MAALAAVAFGPARLAAATQLTLDLFPGWGWVVKSGDWMPVRAEIHAGPETPAGQGRVEVGQQQTDCRAAISVAWAGETHLVRELLVPMGSGGSWDLTAELWAAGARRPIAEARGSFRIWPPQTRLVAGIGAPIPGFRSGLVEGEGPDPYAVIMVEPGQLPRQALAWESVQAARLPSASALALDPEQVTALAEWLLAGGQLLVESGPGGAGLRPVLAAAGLPAVALAAEGERVAELVIERADGERLAEGGGWVYPPPDPGPDAHEGEIRLRVGAGPWQGLWTEHRVGLGMLRVWRAVPERWLADGERAAWSACAGLSATEPEEEEGSGDGVRETGGDPAWVIQAALAHGRGQRVRVAFVAGIAAAYVLLIGFFDYHLVRRLRRPVLTWVTFPLWTAAVVGLAFALGYRLHSGVPTAYGVTLMCGLDPEGERADITSYYLCDPQWSSRYRLEGPGLLRPAQVDVAAGWQASRAWIGAAAGGGTAWEGRLERWNRRLFLDRALGHAPLPLHARWQGTGAESLEIDVDVGWYLFELVVVRGEELWKLPIETAAPGARTELLADLSLPASEWFRAHLEGWSEISQRMARERSWGNRSGTEPLPGLEIGRAVVRSWFAGIQTTGWNAAPMTALETAWRRGDVLVLAVLEAAGRTRALGSFAWADAAGRQLPVEEVLVCAVALPGRAGTAAGAPGAVRQ